MKFTQLSIGQRFELDGAVYVKTSPMMAAKEGGGESRFMARYVVVKVLGGEAAPAKVEQVKNVEKAVVLAAFEQFHDRCREMLDGLEGDVSATGLETLRSGLEEGRARFLAALSSE